MAQDAPTKSLAQRRRYAHVVLAAALSAGSAAAVVLYRFPPALNRFYPRCPIYALTGLQCPGCGMTRALAALLHGHVAEAWHWNPLLFVLLPFTIGWLAFFYRRAVTGRLEWPQLTTVQFSTALAGLAMFTVGRNLL